MNTKESKKDNVIDLARERKKQKNQKKEKKPELVGQSPKKDWKVYLQFVAFLIVFAYFLQTCHLL